MVSLFLVCQSCVSKGLGWEMTRGPPSLPLPLQPHPLELDVKLTVNIFVLAHALHCRAGGVSALL